MAGHRRTEIAGELAELFERARDHANAAQFYLAASQNPSTLFAYSEAALLARRGLAMALTLPEGPARAMLELPPPIVRERARGANRAGPRPARPCAGLSRATGPMPDRTRTARRLETPRRFRSEKPLRSRRRGLRLSAVARHRRRYSRDCSLRRGARREMRARVGAPLREPAEPLGAGGNHIADSSTVSRRPTCGGRASCCGQARHSRP